MHTSGFPCPHCSVPLRIRDPRFLRQTISCPDCGRPVRIVESNQGTVYGVAVEDDPPQSTGPPRDWVSPEIIAWCVAGSCFVAIAAFLFWPSKVSQTSDAGAEVVADGRAAAPNPLSDEPKTEQDPPAVIADSDNRGNDHRPVDKPLVAPIAEMPPAPQEDEKSDPPPVPVDAAAQVIADIARASNVPIDVPMAKDVVTFDVDTALNQRIVEFKQTDAVSVRQLLRLVEEMAAVPIRYDELSPEGVALLESPATVSLSETTVGGILQAVVERATLAFDARPEGIFIKRAETAAIDEPVN